MIKDYSFRIGEINEVAFGSTAQIIEYKNSDNIKVKIIESGELIKTKYDTFKRGSIRPKFVPHIYSVGYLGYSKITDEKGKKLRSYQTWYDMLRRCYSTKESDIARHFTYQDCEVCEEWHNYSNFKEWYDKNYYEIDGDVICLDKDIKNIGNKVYSPENCMFVPRAINSVFTNEKSKKKDKSLPSGIHKNGDVNVITPMISILNNNIRMGSFFDEKTAYNFYKKIKEFYIKELATYYRPYIPNDVYEVLINYKCKEFEECHN